MELGKNIMKIRKDNNLTQDEFAEKYFVTRQTISNWEIGKSYPDLETLVKISNDFKISLDILLKEDSKMVQEIDKSVKGVKKYKNILKYIVLFTGIILLSILIYSTMYFHFKKTIIDKFNKVAIKYNLKQDNIDWYIFRKDESVIYTTVTNPIHKYLDFKIDYENKLLQCIFITGEMLEDNHENGWGWSSEIEINWTNEGKVFIDAFACEDRSNISSSLKDSKGNECDYYARIEHYEIGNYNNINMDFDDETIKNLGVDREKIVELLVQGSNIYKDLYE